MEYISAKNVDEISFLIEKNLSCIDYIDNQINIDNLTNSISLRDMVFNSSLFGVYEPCEQLKLLVFSVSDGVSSIGRPAKVIVMNNLNEEELGKQLDDFFDLFDEINKVVVNNIEKNEECRLSRIEQAVSKCMTKELQIEIGDVRYSAYAKFRS